jgi:hypothetical protein
MKNFLYFLIFLLFLVNVNASENVESDGWFGKFFDRISSVFDYEKKAMKNLDDAFKDLYELNNLVLNDIAEINKEKYISSMGVIKNNLGKVRYNPDIELENILRLEKWLLEYELILEDRDFKEFEKEVDELKEVLAIKSKNAEIKMKAVEKKNDYDVMSIIKLKKKELGVEGVERNLLSKKVFKRLGGLKDKENENVTLAKELLSKVGNVEVEEAEEIIKEVDSLSYE